MDNKQKLDLMLAAINKNMDYYKKMIDYSSDQSRKKFYEDLLHTERICFENWKMEYTRMNNPNPLKVFTSEELAQYDGSNGKPAYVSVNGIVYDVSLEATWGGGTHFSLYAGKDLTGAFNGCHLGNLEVLKNLPKVGVIKPEEADEL